MRRRVAAEESAGRAAGTGDIRAPLFTGKETRPGIVLGWVGVGVLVAFVAYVVLAPDLFSGSEAGH